MPTNSTTIATTPAYLPIAIAGHQYLIDPTGYRRETVQTVRQQADTSTEPGEQSLTPLGLWRRSQETWHHGAGQTFLDGREGLSAYSTTSADPHRFRTSKGIDPWTKGQLSLLNKTFPIWQSASTNLAVLVLGEPVFGNQTYIADGTGLYFTFTPGNVLSFNTSSIETDTSGWQTGVWSAGTWGGGGNTTLTRSTTWSSYGAASLQLTPTGAGTITAGTATGTAGIPVDPGRRYIGGYDMRAAISARVSTIYFDWYNAAGTYISTSTTTVTFSDSTTGTAGMVMTTAIGSGAVSPATAAFAALRIEFASVSGATDIHRVDAVYFAPRLGPFTNVTPFLSADIQAGQAAQTIQSVTTNGSYVWAALGVSGIHRTAIGQTTSTADVPGGTFSVVGYANGRLLAANANVLYEITAPISAPAATTLWTHDNPGFVWKGIAPGRNCIYAFGNAGTNGEIYRITLEPTTTALGAPTHATYLPDGEAIHALQFYAGGIILGTALGIRLGTADGQGNIDYGPLIRTPYPVRCLEPQDRYCWFGWSNYDTASTGLGRVDLGFLTDQLTPAYASDIMATPIPPAVTVQGEVLSVVTFVPYQSTTNLGVARIFAVSGIGVFMEDVGTVDSAKVASGVFETGAIRYSTSEQKQTRALDVRHHALVGTVGAELKTDGGAYVSVGTSSAAASNGTTLATAAAEGESLELRFTLNRAATLTGPELTRWTLKSLPLPHIDESFTLPIYMRTERITDQGDGQTDPVDVAAEISFLKGLEQTRTVVSFQVGAETLTGYIAASSQEGHFWGDNGQYMNGLYTLQMVTCQ